ncbi:MAG: endonuclease/exonuclease/phosphatase family protein [Rhizobiaceae bacterium]
MRIINWNIQRHAPGTWQAKSIMSEIEDLEPDLVCLTEAWEASADELNGFTVSSRGIAWSKQESAERKVLIWSKSPLTLCNSTGSMADLGGALEVRTVLANTQIRVLGLCIPYHMASPIGAEIKRKPWLQHNEFVDQLANFTKQLDPNVPTIVVGDFNRRIPSTWGPKKSLEKLLSALENFRLVTAGPIPGLGRNTVDHIALSKGLTDSNVQGLSEFDSRGRPRSDHFGTLVDFDFNLSKSTKFSKTELK